MVRDRLRQESGHGRQRLIGVVRRERDKRERVVERFAGETVGRFEARIGYQIVGSQDFQRFVCFENRIEVQVIFRQDGIRESRRLIIRSK